MLHNLEYNWYLQDKFMEQVGSIGICPESRELQYDVSHLYFPKCHPRVDREILHRLQLILEKTQIPNDRFL